MVATPRDPERVIRVDFSCQRRELRPKPSGFGAGTVHHAMPPPRRSNVPGPGPGTVVAVARVIAEKADADTIESDLEVIFRLLRQNCSWSDESLMRLGRTVAAFLGHTRR